MKFSILFLLLAAIGLAGCGPHRHWSKSGISRADMRHDYHACANQSVARLLWTKDAQNCAQEEGGFATPCEQDDEQMKILMDQCMQNKGYSTR